MSDDPTSLPYTASSIVLLYLLFVLIRLERRMQQDCMDALGAEECADIYEKLQTEYSEEFRAYNLSTLTIAIVIPLVSLKSLAFFLNFSH